MKPTLSRLKTLAEARGLKDTINESTFSVEFPEYNLVILHDKNTSLIFNKKIDRLKPSYPHAPAVQEWVRETSK